jgi:2-polyprenyl-3-methyl-5-hydroxy-6-metoxy-1,4-benzoquinol methylase
VTRLNAQPGARYMHPQAPTEAEGDHARALDVAVDSSPNYLRWIADLCRPHLGASVLEVGSGVGSITERLAQGRSMLATEISDDCLAALERRFANVSNVRVARLDLRDPAGDEQFDSVVMINVLEHIRDDAGALSDLRRLLRPSGTLVLYVPALNGLYGPWDRAVGHCRRYSKWRLREVARAAGLVTAELRYANLLAIPAWLAFSRTRVERSVRGGLSLWDRTGVPLTRAIESRVRAPIGLNLLAVLRLPGA